GERFLLGDVLHLLPKLRRQVAPLVLPAGERPSVGGPLRALVGRAAGVVPRLLALLLAGAAPLLAGHLLHPTVPLLLLLPADLFDQRLQPLDQLLLPAASLVAGVGLAEALLDVAHLLDD